MLSATKLRQNIYNILDQIAKTGESVSIERNGLIFEISSKKKKGKIDWENLPKRKVMKGKPQDFVHKDWSRHWKPFL